LESKAEVRSFVAAMIVSSREDDGILKLWGNHLAFCVILVLPVDGIQTL